MGKTHAEALLRCLQASPSSVRAPVALGWEQEVSPSFLSVFLKCEDNLERLGHMERLLVVQASLRPRDA